MTNEEFHHLLRKGLGRSILFLQRHDAASYRDLILHACTHNLAYDPQSEGTRANYMFDIIRLTNDEPFYRDGILATLASLPTPAPPPEYDEAYWDVEQLFDFAQLFAQQGDHHARQIMYQTYARRATAMNNAGAYQLIELDGLDGFQFVAEHLSSIPLAAGEWLDEWYLKLVEDRFGKENVAHFIERTGVANPQLMAYVTHVQARRARLLEAAKQRRASLLKGETPGRGKGMLRPRERNDQEQEIDLVTIAARIENTQDDDELHYLGMCALEINETRATSAWVDLLVTLYEQGPCSVCREKIVSLLMTLEALPSWILDECQYDANPALRKMAQMHQKQNVQGNESGCLPP